MSAQGFQFQVTSRTQPGVQVFVVAAATLSSAERILQRNNAVVAGSTIELKRQVTADDLAKYRPVSGDVVQIR